MFKFIGCLVTLFVTTELLSILFKPVIVNPLDCYRVVTVTMTTDITPIACEKGKETVPTIDHAIVKLKSKDDVYREINCNPDTKVTLKSGKKGSLMLLFLYNYNREKMDVRIWTDNTNICNITVLNDLPENPKTPW